MLSIRNRNINERGGLILKNLSLSYSNSESLFSPLSYTFSKGKIYGIIGDSGLGKSTLLHHIAKIIRSTQFHYKGEVVISDDLKNSIAFIFQNSENQLNPIRKINQQLIDINPEKDKETWEYILTEIGISSPKQILQHYPFMNSGGQNQRISWIISLFSGKNLLLADEPVANLDADLKSLLGRKLIEEYKKPNKLAILVSHDIEWLKSTCDIVLYLNKEGMSPLIVKENKLEQLSKQNKSKDLLDISNLFFTYKASTKWILNDLNFSINESEFVGIIAPSGKGKSTLLKVIHQDLEAKGRIEWKNDPSSPRQNTMMVSQNPLEEFNPIQSLGQSMKEYCKKANISDAVLSKIFDHFNLKKNLLKSSPHQLSGGELQRMAIIKSLIFHPFILLLDESFTGLDRLILKSILIELHSYCCNNNIAIIAVMHRREILESFCDRIVSPL